MKQKRSKCSITVQSCNSSGGNSPEKTKKWAVQNEGVQNTLSHRDLRRHILFHSILLCSVPFHSRGGTS